MPFADLTDEDKEAIRRVNESHAAEGADDPLRRAVEVGLRAAADTALGYVETAGRFFKGVGGILMRPEQPHPEVAESLGQLTGITPAYESGRWIGKKAFPPKQAYYAEAGAAPAPPPRKWAPSLAPKMEQPQDVWADLFGRLGAGFAIGRAEYGLLKRVFPGVRAPKAQRSRVTSVQHPTTGRWWSMTELQQHPEVVQDLMRYARAHTLRKPPSGFMARGGLVPIGPEDIAKAGEIAARLLKETPAPPASVQAAALRAPGVAAQAAPAAAPRPSPGRAAEAPTPRPEWEVIGEANAFDPGDAAEDEYYYHVTPASSVNAIKRHGLRPGQRQTMAEGGAYQQYAKGKAFLTDRGGVPYWRDRIQEHLAYAEREPRLVVMRIPKSAVTGAQVDDWGTKDQPYQAGKSYFVTEPVKGRIRELKGRPKEPLPEGEFRTRQERLDNLMSQHDEAIRIGDFEGAEAIDAEMVDIEESMSFEPQEAETGQPFSGYLYRASEKGRADVERGVWFATKEGAEGFKEYAEGRPHKPITSGWADPAQQIRGLHNIYGPDYSKWPADRVAELRRLEGKLPKERYALERRRVELKNPLVVESHRDAMDWALDYYRKAAGGTFAAAEGEGHAAKAWRALSMVETRWGRKTNWKQAEKLIARAAREAGHDAVIYQKVQADAGMTEVQVTAGPTLYGGIPIPGKPELEAFAEVGKRVLHGPQDEPELRQATQQLVRQYHHDTAGEIAQRAVELNSLLKASKGWRGALNKISKKLGGNVKLSKGERQDMIFYIDAGGISGKLKPSATKGNLFKKGDTTAKLMARMTPAAKAAAARVEQHLNRVHEARFKMLKDAGIDVRDPQLIEDYITHFYEGDARDVQAARTAFRTRNPLDNKRFYETMEAALDATQGRLTPKFQTVEEYVRLHDAFNIKAAYGLKLVNDLKALDKKLALPLVLTPNQAIEQGYENWPRSTHWVWRGMGPVIGVQQPPVSQKEWIVRQTYPYGGKVLKRAKTRAEAEAYYNNLKDLQKRPGQTVPKDQVYQIAQEPARGKKPIRPVEVAVNPIVWEYFRSVFGKPWGPNDARAIDRVVGGVVRASAAFNRVVKRVNTTLTPFHAAELGISGIATEGFGYAATPVHLVKLLRAGTKLNDAKWMRDAVGHGLRIEPPSDVQTGVNWLTRKAAQAGIRGHTGRRIAYSLLNLPFKPGDWMTWKTLYAREKVVGYENIRQQIAKTVQRAQKKGKLLDWDADRIKREAATITNDVLGGLDWKNLGRFYLNDPKVQQLVHGIGYAADWTFSTARQGGGIFRGGFGGGAGGGRGGPSFLGHPGAKFVRRFWLRIILGLGAMYQLINYMTTKRDYGEGHFTWNNPQAFGMKNTWWRIYIGKDPTGTPMFISIGKQLPEMIRWFTNTVGQAWSKMAAGPRILLEQIAGHRPRVGVLPERFGGAQPRWYPVQPGAEYEPFEEPGSRLRHVFETLLPYILRGRTSYAGTFPKSRGLTAGRAFHEFRNAWERYAVTGNAEERDKAFGRLAEGMGRSALGEWVPAPKSDKWAWMRDYWQEHPEMRGKISRALLVADKAHTAAKQKFAGNFWRNFARRGKAHARKSAEALKRLGWTQADALNSFPAKAQMGRLRVYKGDIVMYGEKVKVEDIREAVSWFPYPGTSPGAAPQSGQRPPQRRGPQ
jgi:hypothetical protein